MPRHQHVTTCLKGGGPLSKFCTCQHCTLCVCGVCGAYEGGLTTDCPGTAIDFDKQQEVYETRLDYTDDRGWHLGEPMKLRSPRFATTRLSPAPPPIDPRTVVAPSIDWAAVDRTTSLQQALAQKAIAWVLADRACDARSARLAHIEDEFSSLRGKWEFDAQERVLLATLEREKIDFQHACRSVERCDEELRQAARRLVDALEERAPNAATERKGASAARGAAAVIVEYGEEALPLPEASASPSESHGDEGHEDETAP
jgi:hypothetical protein